MMDADKIKIVINFKDNTYWEIPAIAVAHARADYYAHVDERDNRPYEETYAEELEYTLGDNFEMLDWLHNNTDWEDVSDLAVPLHDERVFPQEPENYHRWFTNAHAKVVREGKSPDDEDI